MIFLPCYCFFLQKSLFVLSAYSLILMGALQFKDHSCIQGENSFLALYLILPHCVNFPHPKSHANNLIHASEPMRNYYRLTMTPTKGLRTLLNWSHVIQLSCGECVPKQTLIDQNRAEI